MFIQVTESAMSVLKSYGLSAEDRIRLVYDSEGCGCAVSGIASLWLVNEADPDDERAESNAELPLYYLRRQAIFFDDRLKLDYLPERRSFRLSSDGQIYGSGIIPSDRRGVSPTAFAAPQ